LPAARRFGVDLRLPIGGLVPQRFNTVLFEMEKAMIRLDIRQNYGKPRFNAWGLIAK
jgi:hypothetical protein